MSWLLDTVRCAYFSDAPVSPKQRHRALERPNVTSGTPTIRHVSVGPLTLVSFMGWASNASDERRTYAFARDSIRARASSNSLSVVTRIVMPAGIVRDQAKSNVASSH